MRLFAVSFVLGALVLQHEAALPQWRVVLAGCAATLAIALLPVRMRSARAVMAVIAGCLVGYGWAAWRAESRMADALPLAWEGRDIAVIGVVAGLPQEGERGVRFLFDVEAVATPAAVVPQRIALTWYPERAKGAEPGSFYSFEEVRRRTPDDPDVNTRFPDQIRA